MVEPANYHQGRGHSLYFAPDFSKNGFLVKCYPTPKRTIVVKWMVEF